MQQQFNQMMLQFAAGIFGNKHLKEQKTQTAEQKQQTIEAEKQTKELKNQTKEKVDQAAKDWTDIIMSNIYEITDTTEDSPMDKALIAAQENLWNKDAHKRIAQARKDFGISVAKGENLFATPPTPPKTGGDK